MKSKQSKPQVRAKTTKKKAGNRKPQARAEKKMGRPSLYSEEVCKAICGWITQGLVLREIGALSNMPDKSTIIRWLAEHEDFRDQYARAHEIRALLMIDEVIETADDARNDYMERLLKDGTTIEVVNEEAIARAKLRIESRKWLMEKMAPKRFGRTVALTGKNGGPIKTVQMISDVLDEIDGADTGLPARGLAN